MPTDIIMPQMGESIVEGTITKWLKKAGDKVQRDEPLFEISTDKVDAEIPSPAAGILQEIKVAEGATVQVNTIVGTIAADGEAATAAPKAAAPEAKKEAPKPQAAAAPQPAPSVSNEEDEHARSSPLVRKMARENNIDLAQVEGSGLGGRITKQDITAFLEKGSAAPPPAPAAPKPAAAAPAPASKPTPAAIPGELVPLTNMRRIIA
ncbi:MAG TPA: biotin/lipoyl-containing protein, partial [Terriglobales bacterium]|nr:biotin/lipoyl-containing protein [Terriglobales bacterium]